MKLRSPSWFRRVINSENPDTGLTCHSQRIDRTQIPTMDSVPSLRQVAASKNPEIHTAWDRTVRRIIIMKIQVIDSILAEAIVSGQQTYEIAAKHEERLRKQLDQDIGDVLDRNREKEILVRTLAWALPGNLPHYQVPFVDVQQGDPESLSHLLAGIRQTQQSAVCWWPSRECPPAALVKACREVELPLLAAGSVHPDDTHQQVWHDVNPVQIERDHVAEQKRKLVLSGSAGCIQAFLGGSRNRGWIPVRPPTGFLALQDDILLSDFKTLLTKNRIALLWSQGPGSSLVFPQIFFNKFGGENRFPHRDENQSRTRKDMVMKRQGTGYSDMIFPQSDDSLEPMSLAPVVIALDPRNDGPNRDTDELGKPRDITAQNIREVCSKFQIHIEGEVEDVTGKLIPVQIPVKSDETFTVDGLTRNCPPIFDRYQQLRALQEMMPGLEKNSQPLSDEEIADVKSVLPLLEDTETEAP